MSIIILFNICMITILFIYIRIVYTCIIMNEADKKISMYISTLSYKEQKNKSIYYKQMKRNYIVYVFSFWLWGVYDAFVPEYKNMVKYIEEENKHVKKRAF